MFSRIIRAAKRRLLPVMFPIDYPRLRLAPGLVEKTIESKGAHPWHIYAFKSYEQRLEAHRAMQWIARNVPKDAAILETGCGAGPNLMWLAQRGFSRLKGMDIDAAAIEAGKELAGRVGTRVELKVEDSVSPKSIPQSDVVIALAWVYLRDVEIDLPSFMRRYREHMPDGGHLLMDMVDSSFDEMKDNEDRTDDWHLPTEERRPTQYILRLSTEDMQRVATSAGFEVVAVMPGTAVPPRKLYVMRKN